MMTRFQALPVPCRRNGEPCLTLLDTLQVGLPLAHSSAFSRKAIARRGEAAVLRFVTAPKGSRGVAAASIGSVVVFRGKRGDSLTI